VFERRWSFVKKGLFVWAGFFQGSKFLRGTSLWFSNPVFTAAAVLSPVNKKAKPQSPGSRTNTPSCWEGSPARRVLVAAVAQGAAVRLPVTSLSFMKSQPTIASVASLQKGLSAGVSCLHEYGIHAKMLRPSLSKGASFTQNAYEPQDSHQRLSSLYAKPAALGSLNALFTFFFFFLQDNQSHSY